MSATVPVPLHVLFARLSDAGLWAVVRAICEASRLGPEAVIGPDRTARPSAARRAIWAAIHALRDTPEGRPVFSLSEIGRLFERDHTTVLAGIRLHETEHGPTPIRLFADVPREPAPPPRVEALPLPLPVVAPAPVFYVPPPALVEEQPVVALGEASCVLVEPVVVRLGVRCDKPATCPKMAPPAPPSAPRAKAKPPRKASPKTVMPPTEEEPDDDSAGTVEVHTWTRGEVTRYEAVDPKRRAITTPGGHPWTVGKAVGGWRYEGVRRVQPDLLAEGRAA